MAQNNIIQTPFGIYGGVIGTEYYEDGGIKSLRLGERNMILTHAGELVPFYSEDTQRRKHKASLTFYREGTIKSVALDEQQEIITPIGEFPAELVTFYPTGEMKRFFPLDGRLSGYWSEEDERALNIPFSFEFPFSSFTAMLIGICFYESGDIRSVTLFPGEGIRIATDYGVLDVRGGFSLYESGELESLEPFEPQRIVTPIGPIYAYDINASGINAYKNSLRFDKKGRLVSAVTSGDKIVAVKRGGGTSFFLPTEKPNPEGEDGVATVPLRLDFDYESDIVTITGDRSETLSLSDCTFRIYNLGKGVGCSPDDCASCSLCSH